MLALPLRAGYLTAHSLAQLCFPQCPRSLPQERNSNEAEQFVEILLKIGIKLGHAHQITSLTHFSSFLCQPWAYSTATWILGWVALYKLSLHIRSHMCKHFICERGLTLPNILYQTGNNMFSPAGSMEEFTAELSHGTTSLLKGAWGL